MAECVAAVAIYNYQDVLYGTSLLHSHSQNSVLKRNLAFSEALCLRSSTKTVTSQGSWKPFLKILYTSQVIIYMTK